MEPLVSICTTTYRHEKYLAQTLDSFLAQRVNFPYEILIHDDASPDGTEAIIRDYAARYPQIIFPLYETENQYSQNIPINETFNFPRARGKYIALCEGDDYWCDPEKLQRQIDYMEAHEGCTFCFTNGWIEDEAGVNPRRPFVPYYENEKPWYPAKSSDCSLETVARLSFIPTASFVFRTDALRSLPREFREKMCQYGDLRMKLYLTAAGYARYEHIFSCVYRENVPTSAFQVWKKEKRAQVYERARTAAELAMDVDRYSGGRAHDALCDLRDSFVRIMVHNAPDLKTLLQPDLTRVLHKMPVKERLRCTVRLMLPPKAAEKLAVVGREKEP